MSFKIHKFDPRVLNEKRKNYGPVTCVFIGRRGTGKSTLVSDILYHIRNIPSGMIISGTEGSNSFYSKYLPDLFIHDEFNPDLIKQLISRQKKLLMEMKNKDDPIERMNLDTLLLLDDLGFDNKWTRDKNIRGIFMNGRWYRILCLITAQYCMTIPPDLRGNVDYVFLLKENIVDEQKKLYKYYFGMFDKFDTFRQVLMQCTENHECLVLDNTSRSQKIEDCVFWYKATPNRQFRIGSKKLWEYHNAHYNNKYMLKTIIEKPEKSISVNVSKAGKAKKESDTTTTKKSKTTNKKK